MICIYTKFNIISYNVSLVIVIKPKSKKKNHRWRQVVILHSTKKNYLNQS
jgi:hypothetical protein